MKERAVFYVPHADDEAIGMAGTIQRLKEAGVSVHLVLLTDGYNSKVLEILNGIRFCSWHNTYHHFDLSMEQLIWARRREFAASARALGVDRSFIANGGRGLPDLNSPLAPSYDEFVKRIGQTVTYFHHLYPESAHHFTSGLADSFAHSKQYPKGKIQPTHLACWEAATSLSEKLPEVIFHRIYVYLKPKQFRSSETLVHMRSSWLVTKKAALSEYMTFSPNSGRFAIGYHSAGNVIDAAKEDGTEYLDTLS